MIEALTTGRMLPLETNSPLAVTTERMQPSETNSPPSEVSTQ